ncbi:MAG: hypothetical protein OXE02_10850 [Chloroflexi bacterium]|nr:hypothetical protein [Chloroflexota bacterium]
MPAKGIWIAMPVATKQFPDGWWSLAVKAGICAHGDSKEAAERRFDEALTLWAASAPSTEVLLARLRAAGIPCGRGDSLPDRDELLASLSAHEDIPSGDSESGVPADHRVVFAGAH